MRSHTGAYGLAVASLMSLVSAQASVSNPYSYPMTNTPVASATASTNGSPNYFVGKAAGVTAAATNQGTVRQYSSGGASNNAPAIYFDTTTSVGVAASTVQTNGAATGVTNPDQWEDLNFPLQWPTGAVSGSQFSVVTTFRVTAKGTHIFGNSATYNGAGACAVQWLITYGTDQTSAGSDGNGRLVANWQVLGAQTSQTGSNPLSTVSSGLSFVVPANLAANPISTRYRWACPSDTTGTGGASTGTLDNDLEIDSIVLTVASVSSSSASQSSTSSSAATSASSSSSVVSTSAASSVISSLTSSLPTSAVPTSALPTSVLSTSAGASAASTSAAGSSAVSTSAGASASQSASGSVTPTVAPSGTSEGPVPTDTSEPTPEPESSSESSSATATGSSATGTAASSTGASATTSGGSSATSTRLPGPAVIGQYVYAGCVSQSGPSVFNLAATRADNSPAVCISICQAKNNTIAGTAGLNCYCGNGDRSVVNALSTVSNGACNIPCPGALGQFCGGQTSSLRRRQAPPAGTVLTTYFFDPAAAAAAANGGAPATTTVFPPGATNNAGQNGGGITINNNNNNVNQINITLSVSELKPVSCRSGECNGETLYEKGADNTWVPVRCGNDSCVNRPVCRPQPVPVCNGECWYRTPYEGGWVYQPQPPAGLAPVPAPTGTGVIGAAPAGAVAAAAAAAAPGGAAAAAAAAAAGPGSAAAAAAAAAAPGGAAAAAAAAAAAGPGSPAASAAAAVASASAAAVAAPAAAAAPAPVAPAPAGAAPAAASAAAVAPGSADAAAAAPGGSATTAVAPAAAGAPAGVLTSSMPVQAGASALSAAVLAALAPMAVVLFA